MVVRDRVGGYGWRRAGSQVPVGEPPVAVAAPSWKEESSRERPGDGCDEGTPIAPRNRRFRRVAPGFSLTQPMVPGMDRRGSVWSTDAVVYGGTHVTGGVTAGVTWPVTESQPSSHSPARHNRCESDSRWLLTRSRKMKTTPPVDASTLGAAQAVGLSYTTASCSPAHIGAAAFRTAS